MLNMIPAQHAQHEYVGVTVYASTTLDVRKVVWIKSATQLARKNIHLCEKAMRCSWQLEKASSWTLTPANPSLPWADVTVHLSNSNLCLCILLPHFQMFNVSHDYEKKPNWRLNCDTKWANTFSPSSEALPSFARTKCFADRFLPSHLWNHSSAEEVWGSRLTSLLSHWL